MNITAYTFERLSIIEDEIVKCENEKRKNDLQTIKDNILKFMRANFKVINGRDVRTIGFDEEKKICVIEYNHNPIHSGKSVYYYGVNQEQFDILMKSDNVGDDADFLFKDNIKK